MHPKFAERRAWVSYERDTIQDLAAMNTPAPRKARARYTVQFGSIDLQGRASDPIECKDMRDAARLAANVCFVFGSLSPTHSDDYWLLSEGRDSLEWKSSTQFVRLTRTYPTAKQ
jgi:hypothetical protein